MRIEGLYYDQQGGFGFANQLRKSTTIRVGLSAQSYPLPAPTDIADIRLRLPGDETITSLSAFYGPYDSSYGGQVDLETPIIDKKLGAVLSAGGRTQELDWHSAFYVFDFWSLFRWTLNDNTEVTPFVQFSQGFDSESRPLMFTGGSFLPPEID